MPDSWLEDSFDLPGRDVPPATPTKPRELLTGDDWSDEIDLPGADLG